MALYMISFITYGAIIMVYTSVLPRLARNIPHIRQLLGKHEAGGISAEEYEIKENLEKKRIGDTSTVRSWKVFLVLAWFTL